MVDVDAEHVVAAVRQDCVAVSVEQAWVRGDESFNALGRSVRAVQHGPQPVRVDVDRFELGACGVEELRDQGPFVGVVANHQRDWSLAVVREGGHGRLWQDLTVNARIEVASEVPVLAVGAVELVGAQRSQPSELAIAFADHQVCEAGAGSLGGREVQDGLVEVQPSAAVAGALRNGAVKEPSCGRRSHEVEHGLATR
jgi:hypothetical protein